MRRRKDEQRVQHGMNEGHSTGGTNQTEDIGRRIDFLSLSKKKIRLLFANGYNNNDDEENAERGKLSEIQRERVRRRSCLLERVNTQEINHTFVLLKITCLYKYRCKVPAK